MTVTHTPQTQGHVKICVWPDETWCFIGEIEQYSWMSDDYAIVNIPEELTDKDIEEIVKNVNSQRRIQ